MKAPDYVVMVCECGVEYVCPEDDPEVCPTCGGGDQSTCELPLLQALAHVLELVRDKTGVWL